MKKNSSVKRIAAWILSAALLWGLVPAQPAKAQPAEGGAAETARDYYYSIAKANTNTTEAMEADYIAGITYEMTTAGSGEELNPFAETGNERHRSDPWACQAKYVRIQGNPNIYVKFGGADEALALANRSSRINIKVKVAADGVYRPYAKVKSSVATQDDLRFCAYDAETDTVGDVLAQSVNTDAKSADQATMIGDQELELAAGEYVFVYEIQNGSGTAYGELEGFGLQVVEQARDYYYSIVKAHTNNEGADYIAGITYEMTTAGSSEELNPYAVTGKESHRSDPWACQEKYTRIVGNPNVYVRFFNSEEPLCLANRSSRINIKVKVAADGVYRPYAKINSGTRTQDTLRFCAYEPGTDTVGTVLAQLVDTDAKTADRATMIGDQALTLTAGEYVFIYEIQNGNGTAYGELYGFGLQSMGSGPQMSVSSPEVAVAAVDGQVEIPLELTLSDGSEADIESAGGEAQLMDPSLADARVERSGQALVLKVTGKKSGRTRVNLSLWAGSSKATHSLALAVDGADGRGDFTYDFLKAFVQLSGVDYLKGVTYASTTAGTEKEINPGKYPTLPWAYQSFDISQNGYCKYNYDNYGIDMYCAGKAYFKLIVPASGLYRPETLVHLAEGNRGEVQASLMRYDPKDNAVGEVLAQSAKTASGQANARVWLPMSAAPVELAAGEYVLCFETLGSGAVNGQLDAFRLNAVRLEPEPPASIPVGETVSVAAFRGVEMACESLAAAAEDSAILRVETDTERGLVSLTALAPGSTTVTMRADGEYGGEYTIPIRVIRPDQPEPGDVLYDFKKANLYQGAFVPASGYTSYNLTARGADGEIRPQEQNAYGAEYGAWKYDSWYGSTGQNAYLGFDSEAYGLAAYGRFDTRLRLLVPESGMYQVVPLLGMVPDGGEIQVSLARADAGLTGTAIVLGSVTNQAAESAWGRQAPLPGAVELASGEYVLTLSNTGRTRMIADGVLFKAVAYDLRVADSAVGWQEQKTIQVTALDSQGAPADLTGANVDVRIDRAEIADVVPVIEEGKLSLQVQGNKVGSANITLTVTDPEGKVGAAQFTLWVNAAGVVQASDHVFNFHKLCLWRASGENDSSKRHKGVAVATVTDFAQTTEGDPAEINPNSTAKTDPWRFLSVTANDFGYSDSNYGLYLGYDEAEARLGIRLTEDGLYQTISECYAGVDMGIMRLYLAPDGAENPKAEEYLLGEVDCYAPANNTSQQFPLKIRELAAGDYTLTYQVCGTNPAVQKMAQVGFGRFLLKATTSRSTYRIETDPAELVAIGETNRLGVRVIQSDGANSWPIAAEMTAESSAPEIAAASVESSAGQKESTLVIEGKSEGNAIVTVRTMLGGESYQTELPITVVNEQSPSGRSYRYVFSQKVPLGANISTVDSYEKTMQGAAGEMRPETKSDLWRYEGQKASAFYYPKYGDPYGAVLGVGPGAWGAIRIRLPESGIYQAATQMAQCYDAGIARIYLAPADAEDPMAEKYALGQYDVYRNTYGQTPVAVNHVYPLRTQRLTAGDYIVTWKIVGANPGLIGQCTLWIGDFQLNALSEYPQIQIEAEGVEPVKLGNTALFPLSATTADGAAEDLTGAEISVESSVPGAVTAELTQLEDGRRALAVTGLKLGETQLNVTFRFYGVDRAQLTIPVTVSEPGRLSRAELALAGRKTPTITLRKSGESTAKLALTLYDQENLEISQLSAELQGMRCVYTTSDPSVAEVGEDGTVVPKQPGKVTLGAEVAIAGATCSAQLEVTVSAGKTRSSYYTAEKAANARENAERYDWARSIKNAAASKADRFVGMDDELWSMVTTQELPRSYYVGYRPDPEAGYCRYPDCKTNLAAEYGSLYAWITDPLAMPWKVQCPKCRRKFPSNDFESFYKLGIDEHGNWSYELAKQKNAELVAAGEDGYLVNKDYPEVDKQLGVTGWGVDDGYGYLTGHVYPNNTKEAHTYISFYNHWAIWHSTGFLYTTIETLRDAYLYTGDAKYGRAGAILIDRIADVYPSMSLRPYQLQMNDHPYYIAKGKVLDRIWENQPARDYSKAYDAFFPMYEDASVIRFLSQKAEKYQFDNPKTSANWIRENCEDGILRETFREAQCGVLNGNFGMTQSAVAAAAVVLDSMPETREMLDWVFQDGEGIILEPTSTRDSPDLVTGGNVMRQIIDKVDRDGISDEIAPNYANIWLGGMNLLLEALEGYDGYSEMDLYNNPRFVKMLKGMHALTMSRRSTVQIGDSGAVASPEMMISASRALPGFKNTRDPEFAQILYFLNGSKTNGLHYDIFTKDPESLAKDVQKVIDTYGEYPFDDSKMLAGYGLAALRGGTQFKTQSGVVDSQRTFWMNFNRGAGHGHNDGLNLGVEAYGLNIAPELGYPHQVMGDVYYNWGKATVSHNTVVVDQSTQLRPDATSRPLHFDDAGMVQVMDVDASERYGTTSNYRRTVVTVDADDEISYGVDFFRVTGGNDHTYSFHALTNLTPQVGELDGTAIEMTPQKDANGNYVGSYAGANVPFEQANVTSGYSYLKNVDRAAQPGNELYVDFKIQDFRKTISTDYELYLRLTMLNDFDLSELAIAEGKPAEASDNPEGLKFMLAKRTGANLDSLFTTVIEPYNKERYVESMAQVPVTRADGSAVANPAEVKAVKVTLTNGRSDYIVYAADKSIEYRVDDLFNFQGFVGVYSVKDGENVYAYLNDGTKLGDMRGETPYTGSVTGFTKELSLENTITIAADQSVDPAELEGKFIYIDGGASGNGAYEIKKATSADGKNISLEIGDVTLIHKVNTATAGEYTYYYNIAEGARFQIPRTALADNRPVFEPVGNGRVFAENRYSVTVSAVSPIDKELSYEAVSLPRGASFDEATHTLTWTPDNSQIGVHHVAISASDGALTATVHFEVQVAQSGTGGGGATPNPEPDPEPNPDPDPEPDPNPDPDPDPTPGERFIDLGGYDWAKDAINELAEAGVIKGTSANTYSPGANITRADFALLLTRAFKLTSDSTENFADVAANKYYAAELAIAKANGIVNGIGNNKFKPEGQITRQDMMVMLERALKKLGYELGEAEGSELAAFSDAAQVADYAKEAVALLIGNGIVAVLQRPHQSPGQSHPRRSRGTLRACSQN